MRTDIKNIILPDEGSDQMTGEHHFLFSGHKHMKGLFQSMLLIQWQPQLYKPEPSNY